MPRSCDPPGLVLLCASAAVAPSEAAIRQAAAMAVPRLESPHTEVLVVIGISPLVDLCSAGAVRGRRTAPSAIFGRAYSPSYEAVRGRSLGPYFAAFAALARACAWRAAIC